MPVPWIRHGYESQMNTIARFIPQRGVRHHPGQASQINNLCQFFGSSTQGFKIECNKCLEFVLLGNPSYYGMKNHE